MDVIVSEFSIECDIVIQDPQIFSGVEILVPIHIAKEFRLCKTIYGGGPTGENTERIVAEACDDNNVMDAEIEEAYPTVDRRHHEAYAVRIDNGRSFICDKIVIIVKERKVRDKVLTTQPTTDL